MEKKPSNRDASERLLQVGGIVASLWVLAVGAWFVWYELPKLLYSRVEAFLVIGILLGVLAFALNGLTMLGSKVQLEPQDKDNFWRFVTSAPPADEARRRLWRTVRRSLLILTTTGGLMLLVVAVHWVRSLS